MPAVNRAPQVTAPSAQVTTVGQYVSYALIATLLGAPTIIVIIALLIGGVFKW